MSSTLLTANDAASDAADVLCRTRFSVGGIGVELVGEREDVGLIPSLMPFKSQAAAEIQVRVEWVSALSPVPGAKLFDSGSVWRLYEDERGYRFDFIARALGEKPYKRLLVDREFRRAILWMNREVFTASPDAVIAPIDYPLDELLIMHRLTQEKGIELHACGIVGADGMGNLFVGHSGAGKSTTTRLWTECVGVEVLSDDRIIVRRDTAQAKQKVPRLRDRSAAPSGHSARDDREKQIPRGFAARNDNVEPARNDKTDCGGDEAGMRMYGTPWHGEARYASPGSAPLRRILVLEHGRGNVLTLLSPSQAVAELFARSFVPFHRHEYVESALEFLQELATNVPCYRYAFEPNQRAVETILNLHD